jgi:hypothetical protein
MGDVAMGWVVVVVVDDPPLGGGGGGGRCRMGETMTAGDAEAD